MMQLIPLLKVGPWLSNFIVKKSKFTLREIGEKVMRIHYTNVTKRLNANNVSLEEIQDIGDYIGMKIFLMVSNPSEEEGDKEDPMIVISNLQSEVISLQKELMEYKSKTTASQAETSE